MKGLTKLFAGVIAASMLASCGGGNTPEKAANEFLTAVKAGDKAKSDLVSTEDTKSMLAGGTFKVAEVKDVKCSTLSDTTATCTYCCEEGKTEGSSLNLVKRSDKWLVDMKKEGGDMSAFTDALNSIVPDSTTEEGEGLEVTNE